MIHFVFLKFSKKVTCLLYLRRKWVVCIFRTDEMHRNWRSSHSAQTWVYFVFDFWSNLMWIPWPFDIWIRAYQVQWQLLDKQPGEVFAIVIGVEPTKENCSGHNWKRKQTHWHWQRHLIRHDIDESVKKVEWLCFQKKYRENKKYENLRNKWVDPTLFIKRNHFNNYLPKDMILLGRH